MAQSHGGLPLSCPLCQADGPVAFYRENDYRFWRCRTCRLLFLWPPPDPAFLQEHYQGYLPDAPRMIRRWDAAMAPVFDSAADTLQRLIPNPGRLLDVGCGFGAFLQRMQGRGFCIEGVELSGGAAELARQRTGAPIHSAPIEEIGLERTFNAITMFYVIEHLRRPWSTLAALRSRLNRNGVLLLRYPNTTPLLRLNRTLARRLGLMQAPSHLFDFSEAAMRRMLQQAGFGSMETRLDSNTRPSHPMARCIASVSGAFGQLLSGLSRHRLLVPGVSRTTLVSGNRDRFRIKLL